MTQEAFGQESVFRNGPTSTQPSVEAATLVLVNHMSEVEYDRERDRIRETYGDSKSEAGARREQNLARLFDRAKGAGWTQERLAKKEGKSKSWIAYRLCFGRFLNFSTNVEFLHNGPNNLSEGKFRKYWEATEGDDRDRFREVERRIKEDLAVVRTKRPPIVKEVIEELNDGKWHQAETIAHAIDADLDHVQETLDRIRNNPSKTINVKCEKRERGSLKEYRIFRLEKTVSTYELAEKLGPLIEGLVAEGKKNMATMSPGTVARLAALIKRQLDEWAK